MQKKSCIDIMKTIETTYPVNYACSWDNVGLLVGRNDKEVGSIYIAVDATDEVIETVIRENVDLLITHHPLVLAPLKRVTNEDFIGNRVLKLLRHDCSYYAMHTNYDVLRMGKLASNMLGIANQQVLEVTHTDGIEEGIGCVGQWEGDINLEQCCEKVKTSFALSTVKVFGDLKRKISRVAICPGSGKSLISMALKQGAQLLITGDIDHHEGIDAVDQGLAIIDAGHYGLEHIFLEDMEQFLNNHYGKLIIKKAPIMHPFTMV